LPSPIWKRVGPAISRRARLYWYRLRYRRAALGRGCDIRTGFRLRLGSGGCLTLGSRCVVDRFMDIECDGRIVVGAHTIFGHHCTLAARELVEIGTDCLIAELVSIRDHNHNFDRLDVLTRVQGEVINPVRIGKNVWIGAKVTVMRGVTIGDNAVIGANAVVTKDIPANAIAVGVPARVIRLRDGTRVQPLESMHEAHAIS
jgi:acetyltransferase-like isoleucine patch superfamily enzyme